MCVVACVRFYRCVILEPNLIIDNCRVNVEAIFMTKRFHYKCSRYVNSNADVNMTAKILNIKLIYLDYSKARIISRIERTVMITCCKHHRVVKLYQVY